MNNEARVELVKKACQEMYDSVQPRYNELLKLGDKARSERNAIVRDVNKALKIYEGVSESNIVDYEAETEKLQQEFTEKYGVKLETKMYRAIKPIEKAEIREENTAENKKSNVGAFVGVAAAALGLGVVSGLALSSCNKDNKTNTNNSEVNKVIASNNEAVVEETENGRLVIKSNEEQQNGETATIVSDVEQSVDEVVADSLVLGEYGTFFDASDEEQVMARAQYIYDNYYAKFMSGLGQAERDFITVERIANTIRVVNGHCPLDENGYMQLDANTHLTYGQAFTELVCNTPSSRDLSRTTGRVEFVPAYLFAEDGSDLQYFIKSYDDLYAQVAEGRNNNDSEQYRKAGKILAAKYLTEWLYQGMYGNILYNTETGEITYDTGNIAFSEELGRLVHYNPDTLEIDRNIEVYQTTNPYNFDATTRFLAYQSTMTRYPSYIKEAEFNQMATICVPACINYSSKEVEELGIHEIYTAIDDGVWSDMIAKSAGMEVPTEPVVISFLNDLANQLSFEYNHANTLKLN